MFFSLGHSPDPRFFEHDRINDWWFSHDAGWMLHDDCWYKGYDHPNINHGNYCAITLTNEKICIGHDVYRSFPLWWNEESRILTNMLGSGRRIWADDRICLVSDNVEITKVDVCGGIDISPISLDQAVDVIINNLGQKMLSLQNDYPEISKNLFVSGGIDTLILLASATRYHVDIKLLDSEWFEYSRFIDNNFPQIKQNHWAYQQMHHWRKDTILMTGACGDEFFFRGPYTIGLWAAWHGIDIESLLDKSTGYHIGYFNKPKNRQVFRNHWQDRDRLRDQYPTKQDLLRQILNINVNDHQHWHLEKTLTWTPFKDLNLLKTMLRLSEDDILSQILNASVSKEIIQRIDPSCLELLSPTKNFNSRQNLYRVFGY